MAGLQIPLKAGASGTAVAYDTAIDVSYSIYSATLKDYPVPSAFVDGSDTSQVKWGLQVSARSTQNTAWKPQVGFWVSSGTGALSLNSITYPFTRTIGKIDSGNVQVNMYQNGFPTITFDEATNRINSVRNGSATSIATGTQQTKGYIATNTNKFLAIVDGATVKTYAVDANYAITSSTPAGSAVMATVDRAWVVAAKNQYIWVVWLDQNAAVGYHYNRWYGQLYSINSSGVLSTVGAATTMYLSGDAGSGGDSQSGPTCGCGSYVINNVAHVIASGLDRAGNQENSQSSYMYNTVDLATVTVFTTTAVKQVSAAGTWTEYFGNTIMGACYNVGYDGSFGLVVTNLGTAGTPDVYKINAAGGLVDTTVNYWESYLNPVRYRNTTTKLSTSSANTNVSATNTFSVDGSLATGTFTNLHLNCIWIYEMSGSNQEDDTAAFKGTYIATSAAGLAGGDMTLKVNGVTAVTKTMNHINFTSTTMNFTFASPVTVASTKINFLLQYPNSQAQDYKVGFGLNGWTYASPTGTFELSTINLALS